MEDTNKKERWLVIDTDAGVDDAVAICLALELGKSYGVEVKLINAVQGNCSLDRVVTNVAKCREACCTNGNGSFPPPIGVGCDTALDGSQVDAAYFHGEDGLGDVADGSIPEPVLRDGVDGADAIQALVDLAVRAHETPGVHLTLLALGPLTNIARSMMAAEEQLGGANSSLMDLVDELVFMGGCGNGHGNVTRVAEFNVYNDAAAADHVFRNWTRDNITVVSWECTVHHSLPWKRFDDLMGTPNNPRHTPVGSFLSRVLRFSYGDHGDDDNSERSKVDGAVICDALAAVVCLDPETATSHEFVHVEIECRSELTRGMTVVDWGCYDGVTRTKNVKWLTGIDTEKYFRMLQQLCIREDAS